MIIGTGKKCILRTREQNDEVSLAHHADNTKIRINLNDKFPSPYTLKDAARWISHCLDKQEPENFAIVVDGKAVGGCGFKNFEDNARITKEIGYRLGEDYWGQGIVPEAANILIDYIFQTYTDIERIEAVVFARNENSPKVLQKLGFTYEGKWRKRVIKDGKIIDELVYSLLREERSAKR